MLFAFNPITGDHVTLDGDHVTSGDNHMTCLGAVRQLIVLPHLDHTHSHVLLYITKDMKVGTVEQGTNCKCPCLSEGLLFSKVLILPLCHHYIILIVRAGVLYSEVSLINLSVLYQYYHYVIITS